MTDPTPQSSTPSQTLIQEGLSTEIGKAFKDVEASENKAISIEKGLEQSLTFQKICCQKENTDSPLMVKILE